MAVAADDEDALPMPANDLEILVAKELTAPPVGEGHQAISGDDYHAGLGSLQALLQQALRVRNANHGVLSGSLVKYR